MNSLYSDDREKRRIINRYKKLLIASEGKLNDKAKEEVRKAFEIAVRAHKDRRRESGDPFIFHPLSVATIVASEIGLGRRSIIASLLHEAYRSGEVSKEQVLELFGEPVANVLEGLKKIAQLGNNDNKVQADNFRNLLLSISGDVRVILIKIADRLDLMRSMNYITQEKQTRKSLETFYLYAPLAHRLGLYNIKSELEDLSMKYTETEQYKFIIKKLKASKAERDSFINNFIAPIEEKLNSTNLKFEIKSRTKSVYSIWKKMQNQNVPFEQVYDLFAIRIILHSEPANEKAECWNVYSVITDKYQPNPKRLRDWISVPKTNGYESLHTTVVGPDGKWVEVQIRTNRMDEVAEKGFAAHWKYKGIKEEVTLDDWLMKIRDVLETPEQSDDIIDSFKLNLYNKEIFVFTPTGDLKKFPKGSTLLDFAYDIHSVVGDNCVGGKINNSKNVTIKHELENGDVIQVTTNKKQHPTIDWLNFVKTSKAKSRIKQYLKEEKVQDAKNGKEILTRRLKNWKITFSDNVLFELTKHYKFKSSLDFLSAIAKDEIPLLTIKTLLTKADDEKTAAAESNEEEKTTSLHESLTASSTDYLQIDNNLANIDYKLSICCSPVMGDNIFGFVTIGEGIKIRRYDCPNAKNMLENYPYRVVKAIWKTSSTNTSFATTIKIIGDNNAGIMNHVTDIISKDSKVKLKAFFIDSDQTEFVGRVQIQVANTKHLDFIIRKIAGIKGVDKVSRVIS